MLHLPPLATPKPPVYGAARMSNTPNPYAAHGGPAAFDPYREPPAFDDRPARTSVMAILSLIASLPGCCCVPGLPLVGLLLGAISLSFIKNSHGRLTGRGLAIAGLLLGIIMTALQAFVAFGAAQGWTYYRKQMVPHAETFMSAAASGDIAATRATLSPDADAALTDDDILAFMAAADLSAGPFVRVSTDFGTLIESAGRAMQRGGSADVPGVAPIPMAFEFQNETLFGWALLDESALQNDQVLIADVVLFLPSGEALTLRKDGPGAQLAAQMNYTVIPSDLSPGDENNTGGDSNGNGGGAGDSSDTPQNKSPRF